MSIRNLIAGLLVAGLLVAQEPAKPPAQSEIDPGDLIFRQENIFVMAPVIARDLRGNIVNGLTPLDFELYDNGKLQKITEDAASHPVSMVVAVQSSANMEKLLPGIRKVGSLFSGLVLGEVGELADKVVEGLGHGGAVGPHAGLAVRGGAEDRRQADLDGQRGLLSTRGTVGKVDLLGSKFYRDSRTTCSSEMFPSTIR